MKERKTTVRIGIILLILCIPSYGIDKPFLAWTSAAAAAAAADAFTTVSCLNRGACQESNPLFGKEPSTGKIVALKLTSFAITTSVSAYLRHKHSKIWWVPQLVQVTTSGVAAGLNLRF